MMMCEGGCLIYGNIGLLKIKIKFMRHGSKKIRSSVQNTPFQKKSIEPPS